MIKEMVKGASMLPRNRDLAQCEKLTADSPLTGRIEP